MCPVPFDAFAYWLSRCAHAIQLLPGAARIGEPQQEIAAAVPRGTVAHAADGESRAVIVLSLMAFIPVIDGDLIPAHPMVSIAARGGRGCPAAARDQHQ